MPVVPGVGIAIVSGSASAAASGLTKSKPVDAANAKTKGEGDDAASDELEREDGVGRAGTTPIPISGGKAKKRGVDYKCESCSKVRLAYL